MSEDKYVYDFDEPSDGGRELLGGKGVGLAEMTGLGVPVPAGFTVTTDACRAYMANGKRVPEGLEEEIDEHLAALEERTGKRFGDPENPRFARDSYRRLIQMYGEVVDGIDAHRFEQALTDLKRGRGVSQDVDLTAEDLAELIETFKRIYRDGTGADFPQDARVQLGRAVRAVFDSWETPRAQVYRRAHGIPDDLGTAVNVVQMVFGNKGDDSGTGVAFTRDPATGESGLYGEFLPDAPGRDVVAGLPTPPPIRRLPGAMPPALEQR